MPKRKTVAFPEEFIKQCQEKAKETCRPLPYYIQYALKQYWKTEEESKRDKD